MSKVGVIVRDERLRNFIASRLTAAGGEVRSSSSGIEALNWAKDHVVELLVVDLHLEGVHGDDLCKDIKGQDTPRKLPVIMLIEEDDAWFRTRCENAKADVVVVYSQAKEIVDKVHQVLNSEVRINTPGAVDYYVVQSSSKQTYKGKVVDVSLAGLAFKAQECDLERDLQVDIRLRLPQLAEAVTGRCTVVRVKPPGSDGLYNVSLKWDGFKKGDRDRLADWIASRAG